MRLSTAMMLGAATCKLEPMDLNSCALGAALNALGVPKMDCTYMDFSRVRAIRRLWPWLAEGDLGINEIGQEIFRKFDEDVCEGRMTFEQLVDYVRSIEPDEPDEPNEPEDAAVESVESTTAAVVA